MKLLFLDFETQCADAETTNPTEVGALLLEPHPERFRDENDRHQNWVDTLGKLSELIYLPEYPPQTPEIVELTGISDDKLKAYGIPPKDAFARLLPLAEEADYILAHNAAFDRGVFETGCKRLGLKIPDTEWICTLTDVPYPDKYKCRKLSHLAYDHGIVVDPRTLHRAIADVDLLANFILNKYPLEEILAYREIPWAYIRAGIKGPWTGPGGDGGVGKAQAGKLGYSWERARGDFTGPTFTKAWVKRIKADKLEEEKAKAPFKIFRLYPVPVKVSEV